MNGAIGGLLNLLPVRQQLAVIEQTGIYFHVAADAEIVAARWVRHGVVGAADIGIDVSRRIAVDEHVIRTVILAPGQVIGRVDAGDDIALQPECDFIAIALIDRRAGGIAVLQIAGDKAIPNVLVFVVARATRDADVYPGIGQQVAFLLVFRLVFAAVQQGMVAVAQAETEGINRPLSKLSYFKIADGSNECKA